MAESPSELQFEIETLERRHAENPEGRFFVPLANAYRKMGDVETAEALLRSGIERHPDYLSAHIVLGRCLADQGATREAEEEFRFVLSQDPQNLIALRTLGELAAADGRTAEASDWYNELLAVDPMNEDARQALEALSRPGSSEELESEFRSGAGWWSAAEEEASDTSPADAEPPEPMANRPADDPSFYGDVSLDEEVRPDEAPSPPAEAEFEPSLAAEPDTQAGDDWGTPVEEEEAPDEAAPEPGYAGTGSSEVVTETIAELYARQGLHERAAVVYRELIRRRGGDPALEQRLAEIERLAAGELRDDVEQEEEGLPDLAFEDDEALVTPPLDAEEDAFAASFSDGFATVYDDEPSTDEEEAPLADSAVWQTTSAAEETRSGTDTPTIVQLLSAMASWRPGGQPKVSAVVTETETPTEAPPVAEPVEPTGAGEADWDVPSDAEAASDDLPYLQEVSDTSEAAGTGSADDEPFPWELPGAGVEEEAAAEGSWTGQEPESHDPYSLEDVGPETGPGELALPEASPPDRERGEAAPPPEDGTEDEDLESFQAWLRSLKR